MTVLDASAVLAFLQQEDGGETVEQSLAAGAVCGAANWSEVAQKVLARERDWDPARALLLGYGLRVEPVTADDAEAAARLWDGDRALALGDRLCLALAQRLDSVALTGDRAWGSAERVRRIR